MSIRHVQLVVDVKTQTIEKEPKKQTTAAATAVATGENKASSNADDKEDLMIHIVHVSDTHSKHRKVKLPVRSKTAKHHKWVLCHTGDISNRGELDVLKDFNLWLGEQAQFDACVVVCGNHEIGIDEYSVAQLRTQLFTNATHYLQDSGCTLFGIKFWGSPRTRCKQGFYASWDDCTKYCAMIPAGTDIVMTHSPPFGVLDLAWQPSAPNDVCHVCSPPRKHKGYAHWGMRALRDRLLAIKPRVSLFGHVHDDEGALRIGPSTFINSAWDIQRIVHTFDFPVKRSKLIVAKGSSSSKAATKSSKSAESKGAAAVKVTAAVATATATSNNQKKTAQLASSNASSKELIADAQRFSFDAASGVLRAQASGLCVDIDRANRGDGATVVLWPHKSTLVNQRWTFVPVAVAATGVEQKKQGTAAAAVYYIQSKLNDKLLTHRAGGKVLMYGLGSTEQLRKQQQWRIEHGCRLVCGGMALTAAQQSLFLRDKI
jgi:Icc-related predicted phosphoesterase